MGVVGINRSPSCGVETTSRDGHEVEGQGVFIELIAEALRGRGQTIKMIGVKTSQRRIRAETQAVDRGVQQNVSVNVPGIVLFALDTLAPFLHAVDS